MPAQAVDVAFPFGGLDRRHGLQNQPPYTTPDCLNVRPVTGSDRRMRGGTRPGLSKILATQFGNSGSDRPFQLIASVAAINNQRGLLDPFIGSSLSSDWVLSTGTTPTVTGGYLDGSAGTFVIRRTPSIPQSAVQTIELDIAPGNGFEYSIHVKASGAGGTFDALRILISFAADYLVSSSYTIDVREYHAGVETLVSSTGYTDSATSNATFKVTTTGSGYAQSKIYWRNTATEKETRDGTSAFSGWNAEIGILTASASARIYEARIYWNDTGDRVRNLWVCQGNLYVERNGIVRGFPSQYTSDSRWIAHTQYRGDLYTMGTQGLKYSYVDDYPTAWTASTGTLPAANILSTWGGRIIACEQHIFSMSRINDPRDWNYSASEFDAARAFAYTVGETAVIGEWGTAIIPASGDVCFLAKSRSIWAVLGNPAGGGQLVNTSRSTGVLNPHAWTRTADDTIYFLGYDGLYRLAKGQTQNPQKMLADKVPALRPDPDTETGTLVYDHYAEGIHILGVEIDNVVYDFFYHIPTDSLWPVEMPATMRMRSIAGAYSVDTINTAGSRVWIGCKDGYLRRFNEAASNDDGTSIVSNVLMGPIRLAPSLWEGRVDELRGVMGASSGNVTWGVQPGRSGEAAIAASAQATGAWVAGENRISRPRASGQYACIKLSSTSARWVLEEMTMIRSGSGRVR